MTKPKAPTLGDKVWYFPHLNVLADEEGNPVGPLSCEVKGLRLADDGRVLVDLTVTHDGVAFGEVINAEWREHAPKDHGQADVAAPVKQ